MANPLVHKLLLVSDFFTDFAEATSALVDWVWNNQLKYRETIVEGLKNIPEYFSGKNFGKLIGKIAAWLIRSKTKEQKAWAKHYSNY